MESKEGSGVFPVVGVIPSLNPDQKLVDTVGGFFRAGFSDLIVVDDGSRESCQPYFEEIAGIPGCTVLHHGVNRGRDSLPTGTKLI